MRYFKTPVFDLTSKEARNADVAVRLKREDLNHPNISGNKWWKLKYNLEEAHKSGKKLLLTFGGAYSNHLYATASAAKESDLACIGVVRGEETLPLNSTLSFVTQQGMSLYYVNREDYRRKKEKSFVASLQDRFGDFYLIPEGGTNALAIKGVEEWGNNLKSELDFDYLCLPVGTGGTLAGLIKALPDKKIIGFSSLKGGGFLEGEITTWVGVDRKNWQLETDYHFGGYGKTNDQLNKFIRQFESLHQVPLDHVYMGKMIYGVMDLIKKNRFEKGAKILVLHTGGLQGRTANS